MLSLSDDNAKYVRVRYKVLKRLSDGGRTVDIYSYKNKNMIVVPP